MKPLSPNNPPPMNGDSSDRRFSRLFADIREADTEELPAFAALAHPPLRARKLPARRRWVPAASALLGAGAMAVVALRLAFLDPQPAADNASSVLEWTSPTDWLLGGSNSFGSTENTWQSPTDSLFDFAPTNGNT